MRADAGPAVRRGLAAVIEAGPDEASCEPGALVVEAPPLFGEFCPLGPLGVVGGDVAGGFVVGVDAAGGDGAGGLSADDGLLGMRGVVGVDLREVVVEALDVDHG